MIFTVELTKTDQKDLLAAIDHEEEKKQALFSPTNKANKNMLQTPGQSKTPKR